MLPHQDQVIVVSCATARLLAQAPAWLTGQVLGVDGGLATARSKR